MAAGENVRIKVADKKLTEGKDKKSLGNVTISSGVAQVRATDTAQSIIERADKALYYSKENGRNCISGERDL